LLVSEEKIDRVLELVSDAERIDWDSSFREADSADEARRLRNLHVISEVGRLARLENPPVQTESQRGLRDQGVAALGLPPAWPPGQPVLNAPAARAQDPAMDLPLQTWGKLKLLERIGRGGFGEVYRAWDPDLHREVALKLVRGVKAGPGWGDQVLREARFLARVEHPNVVRIYGVENHQGMPGFWMELVRGTDLETLLAEQGPFKPVEAAKIGAALGAALTAIHDAGIVHQDIKPRNVMQTPEGRILLMDFGVGRLRAPREGDAEGPTGTPRFMAPELFEGARPTPRTDIYSLGVLLYHLTSRAYPVEGSRVQEIVKGHREGLIRPLREAAPHLPPAFITVVERAIAPDTSQRFDSAVAMTAELVRAIESLKRPKSRTAILPAWKPRVYVAVAAAGALIVILAGVVLLGGRRTLAVEADFSAVRQGSSRSLKPGDDVSSGDLLELGVDLNRTAHLYVLNVDQSQAAVVLFPVPGANLENPVPAGRHVLPGLVRGERRGWALNDVPGKETFIVLACTERLPGFEKEILKFKAVTGEGGVAVRPVNAEALAVLTRGVTSMARISEQPTGDPAALLFELTESLLSQSSGDDKVWMRTYEFRNSDR
jgi:serine/threonine protein kinase